MLFLNQPHTVSTRQMKFGEITGIAIGENGRGRREVFLPTPKGLEGEISGLCTDLTIGTSKTGRPRINRTTGGDEGLYLILSSMLGYTRKGNGYVRAPKGQKVELIARGNGADGEAGRIGTWDALVLKAHDGDVFRLTWSGYKYGYEPTFYVVANGQVHSADQPEIEELYDCLGLEMPFRLAFDGSRVVTDPDEWEYI